MKLRFGVLPATLYHFGLFGISVVTYSEYIDVVEAINAEYEACRAGQAHRKQPLPFSLPQGNLLFHQVLQQYRHYAYAL